MAPPSHYVCHPLQIPSIACFGSLYHIDGLMKHRLFYFHLILLNITFVRFIWIVVHLQSLFFLLYSIEVCEYTTVYLSILLLMSHFQFCAITNNAILIVFWCTFLCISAVGIPRSGISGT